MALSGHRCETSGKNYQKNSVRLQQAWIMSTMAISGHKCETSGKTHENNSFRLQEAWMMRYFGYIWI